MPFGLNELLHGVVIPALAAGAVFYLVRRVLPDDAGRRFAPSIALVVGFCLGYHFLSLGPWKAASHWHWLPYLLGLSAVIGSAASASGISLIERSLLYSCAAVVSAWLLVPDWATLEPSRTTHIVAWVIAVVACATLLDPLTKRLPGLILPAVLGATLAGGSVVLALSESLRFASVLIAGFGAMAGITLVTRFNKRANTVDGIALPFTVLVCGMMLVGRVNSFSDVPLASYLLVPISPLLLWACVRGPLARLTGWKHAIIQFSLPLIPSGIAIVMAALTDSSY